MKNIRYYIIVGLFIITAVVVYGSPKTKYASPDVLSKLDVPEATAEWRSRDVSGSLDVRDMRYNFISRVFARVYANRYGERLLFLILDAGNFHHPKVCFSSSGAKVVEMGDASLTVGKRKVQAHLLYTEKDGRGTLLVYWICIDKKLTDWTGQKITQLWYSMFNRQKTGYMVRLEIPAYSMDSVSESLRLAQEFIDSISREMPEEQKDYIFGK